MIKRNILKKALKKYCNKRGYNLVFINQKEINKRIDEGDINTAYLMTCMMRDKILGGTTLNKDIWLNKKVINGYGEDFFIYDVLFVIHHEIGHNVLKNVGLGNSEFLLDCLGYYFNFMEKIKIKIREFQK